MVSADIALNPQMTNPRVTMQAKEAQVVLLFRMTGAIEESRSRNRVLLGADVSSGVVVMRPNTQVNR